MGNPHERFFIHTPIHNVWKGNLGTETSKYPEEKKETSIPVSSGERTRRSLNGVRACRGHELHLRFSEVNRTVLGKPAGEGESPVRESRAD